MKQVFNQSLDLLKTGDLVFYRPRKDKGTCGWMWEKIKTWFYRSPYIYVGVVEKGPTVHYVVGTNNDWEVLNYVLQDRDVDVYRLTRDSNVRLEWDAFENPITSHTYTFDGKFVVGKVRELIDKKPHWIHRILFGIKSLFLNKFSNDEQIIKVVNCATVVEYAFNEVGFDFCPRVSPNYATIDVISRSSLIDYLFTLTTTEDMKDTEEKNEDGIVRTEEIRNH